MAGTAASAAIVALLLGAAPATANTTDGATAPDPFVLSHEGRYYAYSTAAKMRRCNGTSANMYVPHRSTTNLKSWGTPSSPACFADVMPGGPGSWADRKFLVWAPTVYRNPSNGQFVLLYSAEQAGSSKQKCIGRAVAQRPGGPFAPDPSPLICPSAGNWAIDPNVWVSPTTQNVFVQWRQDASETESRLWGARYSRDGRTRLTTARQLLSEKDISWDTPEYKIENPAIHRHNGNFYLYYSGNFWDSRNYATGIASCGTELVAGPKCKPLFGTARPWLVWSGRKGGTLLTTPEDLWGPGGMSMVSRSSSGVVASQDGFPYIALHWRLEWPVPARPMALYELVYSPYGPVPINF